MDFMEKVTKISKIVGKTATDTYNTVADKSGKMIEEAKLRISTSEKETEIQKIYEQIKNIDLEIKKVNEKKQQNLMNAMEIGDKWIAVNLKRPKAFTKIKRFFMSKFNTTKLIHKNVITPLNNLVKEFRETELANVKG